ncbi:carboxypeptidase D-like isoform X2 [Bacillus rossius redtenbacheri]|uniref:carboxypeptidase D-like isoform X2 n=1 Tax=Bacillus rossius redtenbacheri TaxID=93214 RepID=UPI002FDDD86B
MWARLCWLLVALLAAAVRTDAIVTSADRVPLSFRYHDHAELSYHLRALAAAHPRLARLRAVGMSVRGRELWVLALSAASPSRLGVPDVKLVGNIHGNEPVGRELILHLAQFLVNNYDQSEEVRWLLDNTRIHLMPSMNPDGFNDSQESVCRGTKGRDNARGMDLNRNFPDRFRPNTIPVQPERDAVMAWLASRPFVLSASLHGGALVANYPYDNTPADKWKTVLESLDSSEINEEDPFGVKKRYNETGHMNDPFLTPDNDVFVHLARRYASTHPTMHDNPTEHLGASCGQNSFRDGITNGAAWYPLTGGMQDYNYARGCLELTLELSCCKYPSARLLPQLWDENRQALLEFISQAHRGVKGVVRDYLTNRSLSGTHLTVDNRSVAFSSSERGEFWRILLPGTYTLKVHKEGYENLTVPFRVAAPATPWSTSATWLDVALYPAGFEVTTTSTATSTSTDANTSTDTSGTPRGSAVPPSAQARSRATAVLARALHGAVALLAPALHLLCTW